MKQKGQSGSKGQIVAESDTRLKSSLVGGRYRLLEVAGNGAMATVHRAQDEFLGRTVAVKTFRAPAPSHEDDQRRRAEMEVLARLSHPSLVQLYDAGREASEDGTEHVTFLVMEFVAGTDLRCRLTSGAMDDDDARNLGVDLAGALSYVHELGIVHRDIKPANILVPDPAPDGLPRRPAKLTDFGIARIADGARLTLTNTTIGTASYLSPEQARGEEVGPASDVYSLGLVLLECLTGVIEFPGSAVESAVARLLRDPRVPERLGEPWISLLPQMTAKDPATRPRPDEVAAALRTPRPEPAPAPAPAPATRLLPTPPPPPTHAPQSTGEPQSAHAPKPAPESSNAAETGALASRRPPRRRSLVWTIGVVLLALLAVALPWIARSATPPATPSPAAPAVPGPLGDHLAQLERSVRP